MAAQTDYAADFFHRQHADAEQSARQIVPLLLDMLHPTSVVDVGCGLGTWLAAFHKHGLEDILGIDGSGVDKQRLLIPHRQFRRRDSTKPLRIKRRYDLVISLEVAEHLPEHRGAAFVASLTRLAPLVAFSAAIPYQGGTHHVNEQWPEYWINHFQERGYAVFDCIRHRIWHDPEVAPYYAQNIFIFADDNFTEGHPTLKRKLVMQVHPPQSLAHPKLYLETLQLLRWLFLLAQDIAATIPVGSKVIFVDEDYVLSLCRQFKVALTESRRLLPFPERQGRYWGAPADDDAAIGELGRLQQTGAKFVAFPSSAFWWLDYYTGLRGYIESHSERLLRNDRLVVYKLRR